jgi:hypothetical protein
MKAYNVYTIGRHRRRMAAKFIGTIRAKGESAIKLAAAEVSKKFSVMIEVRDAATDNWRRPG